MSDHPDRPNEGGPAFPFTPNSMDKISAGMTQRDFFAAHALSGLLANEATSAGPDRIAASACQYADALLAHLRM